jgi:hypothetical protein
MMNTQTKTLGFHGYELSYFLEPGKWMDADGIARLKGSLDYVNRQSGRNLDYAVFDPTHGTEETLDFFKRVNVCVISWQGEPVGFFYNVILRTGSKPAIHAGLIMINRNNGIDLLTVPYAYLVMLQYRRFGAYHYTSICSTPSIIGAFTSNYSNVWPSHRANLIKPPSNEYRNVVKILFEEYIERYFSEEQVEVDTRRFIMRSPVKEMGFETSFHKIPRHKELPVNVFCKHWLDYSRGEDLIQVGQVDWRFYLKGLAMTLFSRVQTGLNRSAVKAANARLKEREQVPALLKNVPKTMRNPSPVVVPIQATQAAPQTVVV